MMILKPRFLLIVAALALRPVSTLACQFVPPNALEVTFTCKDLPQGVSLQKGPPYEGSPSTVLYLQNKSDTKVHILSENAALWQFQSAISPNLLFGPKKEYSVISMLQAGKEFIFDGQAKEWKVRSVTYGEKSVPFWGLEITPNVVNDHFSTSGTLDLAPAYEKPVKPVVVPSPVKFKILFDAGAGVERGHCLATFAPNPHLLEQWESLLKRGCPKIGP